MRIEQRQWTKVEGWVPAETPALTAAQLVFVFGGTALINDPQRMGELRRRYAKAHLFGCSTAGEIYGTRVLDNSLVTTAVQFEHTSLHHATATIQDSAQSCETGRQLAAQLPREGLVHILVLSDGLNVNGSELVAGLTRDLPNTITVTGGLSGDGVRFQETSIVANGTCGSRVVAAVGFYGTRLKVGYGSLGGWDPFGPERLITKSKGHALYELDGRSALALYKEYLGDHAKDLPASGLLFPLSLRVGQETGVVRTILAIDEAQQSMTFAGDVPEGAYVRLMKANFDRLIDGAAGAARRSYEAIGSTSPEMALLISCVGRKLVLKQRIEEEVEGVRDILGGKTVLMGFYSYGEISPFTPNAKCELHNQTMTITVFSER